MSATVSTSKRNPLFAIFSTVFIDLIGFSILIPVFPLLIDPNPNAEFRVTPADWSFEPSIFWLSPRRLGRWTTRSL